MYGAKKLLPHCAVPPGVEESSFRIVPSAEASAMVAPAGFDSVTVNVSFGSTDASPNTFTLMTCSTTPGVNVTVPEFAL